MSWASCRRTSPSSPEGPTRDHHALRRSSNVGGPALPPLSFALVWTGLEVRGHEEARLRVVQVHHRARRFYEREGRTVDTDLAPARNDFFELIYHRRPVRA